METVVRLLLDPDAGLVQDCEVCAALRSTNAALAEKHQAAVDAATCEAADPDSDVWGEGMVHPNEFLLVFGRRKIHETKTGHVAFGWRWVRESRAIAKGFIDEGGPASGFWSDFMGRHLTLSVLERSGD